MAKIFITGSSDGLGLFTAQKLLDLGHEVVLHAKNEKRAQETISKFKTKIQVLVCDLSNLDKVKQLAKNINALGKFDVIIHNAGVYKANKKEIFKINVLSIYMLTILVNKPKKLIYIGSNMHPQGDANFKNLSLEEGVDYSTSKLHILMFGLVIARKWSNIKVNIVDPGWVKTKMANYDAPDSLEEGCETQIWLASNEKLTVTGKYFYHMEESKYSPIANEILLQEQLIKKYEKITGIYLK